MTASMHEWDDETNLFAHSVIGYAIERLRVPKDPLWGAHPAEELATALEGSVTPAAWEASRRFDCSATCCCRHAARWTTR